ncbi:hypothetical protein Lal_00039791 [Lupinus albus]|nr:hypothetical protein Lal_00039791 [Lupinus albus]
MILSSQGRKRNRVTVREWMLFRLQSRKNEAQLCCVLEDYSIRSDHSQGSNQGKRAILPSTFVGSRRYMDQLYFDGIAICSSLGFPDLFLTMTCNPNWPEIVRILKPMGLKPHDHMYTIEFPKRGLPHAHLVIFLHLSYKYPTPDDIDRIICAKIKNQSDNPKLHNLVKSHMIHGPCGSPNRSSPCIKDGKSSRYFPKKFSQNTVIDEDGYLLYRRMDNGNIVEKNGISLDNRFVVPYNPKLLSKYQAHINMEWCNQIISIKYIFKYINKGYDRITVNIESTEDGGSLIKQYLDCRYISPSEACWRIFGFPIHRRQPAVERLYFHLPGEQLVYFNDNDEIDNILSRPTVSESMFTSWMEANKQYPKGRNLCYGQYVSKFVYVKRSRTWKPRKSGYTICRLIWVSPCTSELYYPRMMLTVVEGASCYEDIRTVSYIQYSTFRDVCFAMVLLQDD